MKVLLLLSLILVVCYSHTRLRTHPLVQPTGDQYPYHPDLSTSKDNAQLEFQHTFPGAKETQLNLLRQNFESLDPNQAQSDPYLASFNIGVATVLSDASSKRYIAGDASANDFRKVATSLQQQTRKNGDVIYQFQFRLDDTRGTTIVGTFSVRAGATIAATYNYNIMTVKTTAVNQGPYVSESTALDSNSRVNDAYTAGVNTILELLVSNGDVDAGVNFDRSLTSVQSQTTGQNDRSYLFQVTLSQSVSIIVTASFVVAVRPNDANNYFTDYSYYVQKNRVASVTADAVQGLQVTDADSGAVKDAFNAGVSALADIAISQNDLSQGGSLSKRNITNIQSQRIGVNTNYLFQATLDSSDQGQIYAVNLVVTVYADGSKKLTAFAYNLLTSTSYVTPRQGDISNINANNAQQAPNKARLDFGVGALLDAAKARNDVPSDYQPSDVTVNSFQSQVISEQETTYTFQVKLNDTNGVVVAASISVTVRNGGPLLTAYAYNVMDSSNSVVKSASLETLDASLAKNNSNIAAAVTYGVGKLTDIAVQKGDLLQGTTFIRVTVTKLQRQITGNDLSYVFQANLETGTGIVVAASLSVTLRAFDGQKYLTAYAYSQQVSTTKSVYPLGLSPLASQLAQTDAVINSAFLFGVDFIIRIAINNADLATSFVRDGNVTVLSLKSQTIGNDTAYYFQVRFNDLNKVIVSASFTVTFRFITRVNILSAYAYNVQTSTVANVQAQPIEKLQTSVLQSNQVVIDSLQFGLGALLRIAIHKGDLLANDSFVSPSVPTINKQVTGNDVAYIFQVYANTTNGLQISASISVTNRPSYTLGKILTGYAYIVQEDDITRVNPVFSTLDVASADRTLLDDGVQKLTQIAADAGDIPQNYAFGRPDYRNLTVVTTGNDVGYIFQVYLRSNDNGASPLYQLAASISITRRAADAGRTYLTAYAYNVLSTSVSSNVPTDFTAVDLAQQNSNRVKPLLQFGVAAVKNIAQRNGDITDSSKLTALTVVSIRTQNQAPDYSYSFQVELTDQQGAGLAATVTVTYRDINHDANNNGYILVNYAYNSLITTVGSVSTVISGSLNDDDKASGVVIALFKTGYELITAAAITNNQIATGTNFTTQRGATTNIISAQVVTLGQFSGYQFQANLDNGNGVTIGAAFTVINMGSYGNVVSNYAYNAQVVKKANRTSRPNL